jgi:hypothetical protein
MSAMAEISWESYGSILGRRERLRIEVRGEWL